MNLSHHLGVLWRSRWVAAGGLLLGVVLAVLAAYQVSPSKLERRGTETWSSESSILVTQTGFPWGRVTLPGVGDASGQGTPARSGSVEFADPGRFSNLAMLYSVISYSDQVRLNLPGNPKRDQIKAVPLDATGNGTSFLPVIKVTTTASTPEGARRLNQATLDGLRGLLTTQQKANEIPRKDRVQLSLLDAPTEPVLVAGHSWTPSIFAFLLCLLGTVAVAHILEGLRQRHHVPEEELHDDDWALDVNDPLELADDELALHRKSLRT